MDSRASFIGSYLSERSPHDIPALGFPREIEVTKWLSGELDIDGKPYFPIGPRSFEAMEVMGPDGTLGGRRVMFLAGHGALHLITQDGAYRRVDWADSTRGRLFLLRAATLVLLSAMVLWPVTAFARLLFSNAPRNQNHVPGLRALFTFSRTAHATAYAACALALWFEASFVLVQWRLRPSAIFYGFPAAVQHLLWALPALMIFVGALALFCALAWVRRLWHPARRVYYTLVVAALAIFLYAFGSLHLLAGTAVGNV
jgi:hypothetical protein